MSLIWERVSLSLCTGPEGYSWKFLVEVCRPVLQILPRFQTKKCNCHQNVSLEASRWGCLQFFKVSAIVCVQTNNWFHVFRGLTDLTLQKRLQRTFLARRKIPISGTLAIHGQLKPYPRRMLKITAKTLRYIVLLMAATFWSDVHQPEVSVFLF